MVVFFFLIDIYVILKELNWLARRDGVLLSCIGEKRTKGNTDNDGKIRTTVGGSSSSVLKQN